MYSNVFVPTNQRCQIRIPVGEDPSGVVGHEIIERLNVGWQGVVTFNYLLELGKELDESGYSVICNADYSLVEGGFLSKYVGNIMSEYLKDTEDNRKKSEKYKELSEIQIAFLDKAIKNPNFDRAEFSRLENLPIKEYQEAILDEKADADFIALVNKLITKYDGGKWDKDDAIQFLAIHYRHNKEQFKQNALSEKTWLYKDSQNMLADLIFDNIDFILIIKDTDKLAEYLSNYVDLFKRDQLNGVSRHGLSGSLFSESSAVPLHKKLFGFKKQKEILLKHIEDSYEKYKRDDLEIGSPYVEPEYIGDHKRDTVTLTVSKADEGKDADLFLFVHTMLALEQDKYLAIEGFSYGPTEVFDMYDSGFLFKIRLKNNVCEKTEQKLFESYDEKYHLLKFAGQEIELSKKGKQTDAVLLLQTLLKEQTTEWKHNDEIFEDWGFNDDDFKNAPKNKIYFAGKKINDAVELKTQIKDFIECNTSKARINPKYRKVDE
jgi:hypothetical protein